MPMGVLLVWMPVYLMHDWCPQRPESIRSHVHGLTDHCELPCECWKYNLGVTTKPTLWSTLI